MLYVMTYDNAALAQVAMVTELVCGCRAGDCGFDPGT